MERSERNITVWENHTAILKLNNSCGNKSEKQQILINESNTILPYNTIKDDLQLYETFAKLNNERRNINLD
jgi:hypothetical protein